MTGTGEINAAWAAALIGGLAAAGVRRVVISPGSRSTPLALAALRHAGLDCRVLLDERTAAFYALGLARAEGRPAVLICTSGSAVANWHPAVAEADAARVPMILLSADRPPDLQDCGANQTLDQRGMFGPQVRAVHTLPPAEPETGWLASLAARIVSQSRFPLAGPVQVNVPFREPLLAAVPAEPAGGRPPPVVVLPRLAPPQEDIAALAHRIEGRRGVILAGAEPMPASSLARLAEALGWPILADPLSGMRFGGHDRSRVIARADLVTRGRIAPPEIVLRFGAFPVSKAVGQWQAGASLRVVVSADCRWPDPGRDAAMVLHADPALVAEMLAGAVARPAGSDWLDLWWAAEEQAAVLAAAHAPPETVAIRAALAALPEDGMLFVANSMAIRDCDACSGTAAKAVAVLGNRGVSGIDGTLATFFGAIASGRFAAAVAVVGDLAFLHDLGGLAAGQGLPGVIVLLDNGGGGIFDHLPQASLDEFEQGWRTPQRADLAAAAALWGHAYRSVGPDDAEAAIAAALTVPGVTVVHVVIDRFRSLDRHRALWAASSKESYA